MPDPTTAAILAAHEAQAREGKQDDQPAPATTAPADVKSELRKTLDALHVDARTIKGKSNAWIKAHLDRETVDGPTVADLARAALPFGRVVNLGLATPQEVRARKEAKRRAKPKKQTPATKRYMRATREFREAAKEGR